MVGVPFIGDQKMRHVVAAIQFVQFIKTVSCSLCLSMRAYLKKKIASLFLGVPGDHLLIYYFRIATCLLAFLERIVFQLVCANKAPLYGILTAQEVQGLQLSLHKVPISAFDCLMLTRLRGLALSPKN